MATILKASERTFEQAPGKIDPYHTWVEMSAIRKGIRPENLNFDLRRLAPGQYSSVYHFHRHAEELFVILSGSATLRTGAGLETVEGGDLIFCQKGEEGAHQLYNHAQEPCLYLDIRTFIGYDVCEYPDSDKIFLVPSYEIFDKSAQRNYFDGEEHIREKWEQLRAENTPECTTDEPNR